MKMRDERGEFTLVGLLVAMALFLVVIGATLSLFATSETANRDLQRRTDAMDRARVGIDGLARQMRNMASPTPDQPQAIDRATSTDVIFQTVDPVGPNAGTGTTANTSNVKRVRYCLDGSGTLWMQNQRWLQAAPNAPMDGGTATSPGTSCPGTLGAVGSASWTDKSVVADQVTNNATGHVRPLFSFGPTTTPLTSITSVHADLWVDLDTGHKPDETLISSGVYLRNQNQQPTARLTPTKSAQGIILNGSNSTDPEGEPLTYCWYDLSAPTVSNPSPPCAAGPLIGTGVTVTDPAPADATRTVYLVVRDPALLSSTTGQVTVQNR